jgi:hypothetical protein
MRRFERKTQLETRTKTHHLPQSHQDTKKKVLILLPSVKLRDFPARLLGRLRRPSGRRSGGVSSWHSFSTGSLEVISKKESHSVGS